MRNLDAGFIARLQSSSTSLCRAWTFLRTDGFELNLIEHDEDVVFNTRNFIKLHSIDTGQIENLFALNQDSASFEGGFGAGGFSLNDINAGLWENAKATLYVVDWQSPQYFVQIWQGQINAIKYDNYSFEIDLIGLEAALNQTIGRSFSRLCDANLGDAKCSVNLNSITNKISTIINGNIDFYGFEVASFASSNESQFLNGKISFKSGALSGQSYEIKEIIHNSNVQFKFRNQLKALPQIGDAIDIFIGCDKSFETCKSVFNNRANFRGCPHLPGESIVFATPNATANDGGSLQ